MFDSHMEQRREICCTIYERFIILFVVNTEYFNEPVHMDAS